jgi:phosphatidate cytidylyltransferase
MMTRTLTSLVGVPLILVLLFWPGGWPWWFAVGFLMLMAGYEYTVGLRRADIHVHWVLLLAFGVAFLASALPGPEWIPYSLAGLPSFFTRVGSVETALVCLLLFAGDLAWKRRAPFKNIGATLLGVIYIGTLFPFLAILRFATPNGGVTYSQPFGPSVKPFGLSTGPWLVLSVLVTIWAGDSAAYFVGRKYGRHKCAPAISPNKTWEGVIAGLVASGIAGGLMVSAFPAPPPEWKPVIPLFGLLVGAAGQIGDLFESALKREIRIKDFGNLLPGHGGVLDRFDSLLFAAPVAYWLFATYLLCCVRD